MSAPPYMKLYVADYLGDTHHLGAVEHGAYLLLLMSMWRAGGTLPAADANLAKLARCTPDQWAEIRPVIMPFFRVARGRITHKRIAEEMAKYENTSRQRSEAGKRGGRKKASENNDPTKANAIHQESISRHNQNQNSDIYSDDKSSGANAPPDLDKRAWDEGVALLVRTGHKKQSARAMFGRLVRTAGKASALLPAITQAQVNGTQDPASYLAKAAARIGGAPGSGVNSAQAEEDRVRRELEALL